MSNDLTEIRRIGEIIYTIRDHLKADYAVEPIWLRDDLEELIELLQKHGAVE